MFTGTNLLGIEGRSRLGTVCVLISPHLVVIFSQGWSGGSSGRAIGYQVRSPKFESQSGPNQLIIAPPRPPSTTWIARSLKSRRKQKRRLKQWQTTSQCRMARTIRTLLPVPRCLD
ncbi:hypothetical protein PoB_000905100 [Plakobranchus ocellatus]|uniref:Uncharacterized protein n=1 Tax=Plakobranchus ocellatus TaxID=259542 RepID=A0AAV3YH90_9GAST|nr:hypothetical protein PoB_000905100 [Plakobranchus ocellatus]